MNKVYLAILWHQHQPYYKDLITGEMLMPWVRLHGIKDYIGMVDIIDEFPALKLNFNLVPSLLDQLEDYVSGNCTETYLKHARKQALNYARTDGRDRSPRCGQGQCRLHIAGNVSL